MAQRCKLRQIGACLGGGVPAQGQIEVVEVDDLGVVPHGAAVVHYHVADAGLGAQGLLHGQIHTLALGLFLPAVVGSGAARRGLAGAPSFHPQMETGLEAGDGLGIALVAGGLQELFQQRASIHAFQQAAVGGEQRARLRRRG
jgi:hypothetical protein